MPKRSASTIDLAALLPSLAFVACLLLSVTGLWQSWDRAFGDLLFKVKVEVAPLPLNPRIFPVDLNDRAELNLGSAVDTRQAFADLFQVLGDGKLVGGMDFLFTGTKDPAGDAAMIASAAQMDGLVLAVVPVDAGVTKFSGREPNPDEAAVIESHLWHPKVVNAGRIPVADTFLLPHLKLAQAAKYLAHIGVRPDSDGLYRRTPLFFRYKDGYMPSLPLAMAVVALKLDPSLIEIDAGNQVTLPAKTGAVRISVDDEGYLWIPFPAPWTKTWNRVPLDKVTAAAKDGDKEQALLDLWGDGLVLTADLTTAHKDFGPTPIEGIYPLSGIHSSVLNGLLTGTLVSNPNPIFEGLVVVLFLAAVFWVGRRNRTWTMHVGFAALVLLLLAGSLVLWFAFLTVPWFVAPAVAVAAAWLAATLLRLFKSHEERTLMESALTRYFPRALAARVLDEGKVDLAPDDKDLTIVFSDIAGFTKWSSDKKADQVHGFLSDYLESMAHILFEHGGTVDKFMGDGILAFFGDPFEQPDHAQRAVRAAIAMQAKIQDLQARWGEHVGINLKIRIGINSGRVIVGNLGSITRIEYTVIGAAVNLAQRMESNAPVGGILVTEETFQRVKDEFEFTEERNVTVKGYDEVIHAHVVKQ
jgi:adenylate cyclase